MITLSAKLSLLNKNWSSVKKVLLYSLQILWRASKRNTIILLLLSVIGGFTTLVELWSITNLVDQLIQQEHLEVNALFSHMLPWIAALIGAMLLSQFVNAVKPYIAAILNEKTSEILKNDCFQKALSLSLSSFETEEYYNQLEKSMRSINRNLVRGLESAALFITRMIELLIIIYAVTQVGLVYALLLITCSIPLMFLAMKANKEFIEVNYGQSLQRRKLAYWRDLSTKRESAAELRLFGLGGFFINRWQAISTQVVQELFQARKRVASINFKAGGGMSIVVGIVVLGTVYAGVNGSITIGLLVATLYLLNRFEQVLEGAAYEFSELTTFYFEFQYVPRFLSSGINESRTGLSLTEGLKEGIVFENVGFTYPGNTAPTLQHINLHIRQGEKLSIVGENGAGKSTLAMLVLGLYQPTEGRILVDGVDLTKIDILSWRKKAASVFQNFMKYQLTVEENIFFGNIDIAQDAEKIRMVSSKSGVDQMQEKFPHGYKTLLGKEYEEARDLSGGEWQKIAISRAYYRDAELLVLDEPAAALDAHAELNVYQQFTEVSEGKTVMLISHRLGSARLADRIVYMESGRILEVGTHEELIKRGGTYASLYQLQSEWYQEREVEVKHDDTNEQIPEV